MGPEMISGLFYWIEDFIANQPGRAGASQIERRKK
jgi:hypothetical protein